MPACPLRRLWQMVPTMAGLVLLLLLLLLLLLILFTWVGGDPASVLAGKMSVADAVANTRRQLGVDQPYPVQLLIFVKQILTFDFGNGWRTGEPVRHILTARPGPSLTVLDTVLGVALALAARRGALWDRGVMLACPVGRSISMLVLMVFQTSLAYRLGLPAPQVLVRIGLATWERQWAVRIWPSASSRAVAWHTHAASGAAGQHARRCADGISATLAHGPTYPFAADLRGPDRLCRRAV